MSRQDTGKSESAASMALSAVKDRGPIEACASTCAKRAHAFASRILCDAAEADDVVQQALVVASSKPDQIPEHDPWPWFATVVRHIALRRLRAKSRVASPLDHEPADRDTTTPEDKVATEEFLLALRVEMQRLPEDEREAIALKFYSNLSYREASDHTGIPFNTLISRSQRGMERLRQRLSTRFRGIVFALAPFVPMPRHAREALVRLEQQNHAQTALRPAMLGVVLGVCTLGISSAALILHFTDFAALLADQPGADAEQLATNADSAPASGSHGPSDRGANATASSASMLAAGRAAERGDAVSGDERDGRAERLVLAALSGQVQRLSDPSRPAAVAPASGFAEALVWIDAPVIAEAAKEPLTSHWLEGVNWTRTSATGHFSLKPGSVAASASLRAWHPTSITAAPPADLLKLAGFTPLSTLTLGGELQATIAAASSVELKKVATEAPLTLALLPGRELKLSVVWEGGSDGEGDTPILTEVLVTDCGPGRAAAAELSSSYAPSFTLHWQAATDSAVSQTALAPLLAGHNVDVLAKCRGGLQGNARVFIDPESPLALTITIGRTPTDAAPAREKGTEADQRVATSGSRLADQLEHEAAAVALSGRIQSMAADALTLAVDDGRWLAEQALPSQVVVKWQARTLFRSLGEAQAGTPQATYGVGARVLVTGAAMPAGGPASAGEATPPSIEATALTLLMGDVSAPAPKPSAGDDQAPNIEEPVVTPPTDDNETGDDPGDEPPTGDGDESDEDEEEAIAIPFFASGLVLSASGQGAQLLLAAPLQVGETTLPAGSVAHMTLRSFVPGGTLHPMTSVVMNGEAILSEQESVLEVYSVSIQSTLVSGSVMSVGYAGQGRRRAVVQVASIGGAAPVAHPAIPGVVQVLLPWGEGVASGASINLSAYVEAPGILRSVSLPGLESGAWTSTPGTITGSAVVASSVMIDNYGYLRFDMLVNGRLMTVMASFSAQLRSKQGDVSSDIGIFQAHALLKANPAQVRVIGLQTPESAVFDGTLLLEISE